MSELFKQIRDSKGNELPFPSDIRRPDYRSSGPKRLMPQLMIKVPTLRRWGKKMGVVVDRYFFQKLGKMRDITEEWRDADVSNADIVWFVVDIDERTDPPQLIKHRVVLQTLEHAVEGLTNGHPVTLDEFERRITAKEERERKKRKSNPAN